MRVVKEEPMQVMKVVCDNCQEEIQSGLDRYQIKQVYSDAASISWDICQACIDTMKPRRIPWNSPTLQKDGPSKA